MRKFVACVLLTFSATAVAETTVHLSGTTVPSTGISGTSVVTIAASGFPAGVTAGGTTVWLENACGVTAGASTAPAAAFTTLVGNTGQISFRIPATTAVGHYSLQLTGTDGGGFASSGCAILQVTGTDGTLASCSVGRELGILAGNQATGSADVIAYLPNAPWNLPDQTDCILHTGGANCVGQGNGTTGITVVPLEGSGGPVVVPTAQLVNSCASNSVAGTTVCTGNDNTVYLLQGSGITGTVASAADYPVQSSIFSPRCKNCGAAVNAVTNQAVLTIGYSGSPSRYALQFLDLNNNTFGMPVMADSFIARGDLVWDPFRNLILSPEGLFTIGGTGLPGPGNVTEYANPTVYGTVTEDCTTGNALANYGDELFIDDLTQRTFVSKLWTTSRQGYDAGIDVTDGTSAGLAVAPGTHLAIATSNISQGDLVVGVVQLGAASGSGVPVIVDWAIFGMPSGPDPWFAMGTTSAYTSPKTGKAYGVMSSWVWPADVLGVVDLAGILKAPRSDRHNVDLNYDLVANGLVRFVPLQ